MSDYVLLVYTFRVRHSPGRIFKVFHRRSRPADTLITYAAELHALEQLRSRPLGGKTNPTNHDQRTRDDPNTR